jgi:hypothetical protein
VPVAVAADGLEIRVTFPSGPLAGDLIGTRPLPAKPPKK